MAATCYLFLEYHTVKLCYAARVEDGVVVSVLINKQWDAVKEFQKNSTTIVVVSTLDVSLHPIILPKLNERKKRAALPYLLEDALADSAVDLHFAYDDVLWPGWVLVIQKQYMQDLIDELKPHAIDFDKVTIDWFALPEDEMAVISDTVLINAHEFKGGLQRSIASSKFPIESLQNNLKTYDWLAERLHPELATNLCQAEFQHGSAIKSLKTAYQWTAYLFFACLLSFIALPLLEIRQLNYQTQQLDSKIAVLYQQFFPGAKFITSPEFRIRQWLKGKQGSGVSDFWQILQPLSQVYDPKKLTIHQMRFAQKKLFLNISSPNFQALEQVQRRLEQLSVKVNRTKAVSESKVVKSTLELQL